MIERIHAAEASSAADDAVGTTRYHELPDAGHWLHVDNPAGLTAMVLPSLSAAVSSTS
jgi:pimeloyl-ACP methyl ester carboxylesterase